MGHISEGVANLARHKKITVEYATLYKTYNNINVS
jgi:hypothetical protein